MPLSETQAGIAKIHGMDSTMTSSTVTTLLSAGAAQITMTGADLEENFDLLEIKGQDGNVETLMATNQRFDVTIDYMPKGATRAAAATAAGTMLATPLSKVTLANFKVARYNGDYNYIGGGTIKNTNEGVVVMGMRLRAYAANRASLTAPVIAG